MAFALGTGTARGTFSTITNNGKGTYTATFTATTAGSTTIIATIGGQAVTSKAPALKVVPGAVSLAQSTIAVSPSQIAPGGKTTVTLVARDANGNQLDRRRSDGPIRPERRQHRRHAERRQGQ